MTVGYQESCLRLKLKATVFEELVTFTHSNLEIYLLQKRKVLTSTWSSSTAVQPAFLTAFISLERPLGMFYVDMYAFCPWNTERKRVT